MRYLLHDSMRYLLHDSIRYLDDDTERVDEVLIEGNVITSSGSQDCAID